MTLVRVNEEKMRPVKYSIPLEEQYKLDGIFMNL